MANSLEIGFIGGGRMATALAAGMVGRGAMEADRIGFSDPSDAAAKQMQSALPAARRIASNQELVAGSRIVVLAVKPQYANVVFDELRSGPQSSGLLVSVAAGLSIEMLAAGWGTRRIIRVMPNTPCLIGHGALGMSCDATVEEADRDEIRRLMETVGCLVEVPENLLDVVTGLSGSGPAYVFLILDALIEGGVRMGLPRVAATELALETVRGSAELMRSTGHAPAELRDQVTSPGGTTAAGLYHLEQQGVRAALMGAVEAATRRSISLANPTASP